MKVDRITFRPNFFNILKNSLSNHNSTKFHKDFLKVYQITTKFHKYSEWNIDESELAESIRLDYRKRGQSVFLFDIAG
jgi:hypothetical protein